MKIIDEVDASSLPEGGDENAPTKIRIEFSVGSERDGRWITFGDNVELENIEEWFAFTGQAVSRMFNIGLMRPWHVGFCAATIATAHAQLAAGNAYINVVPNKIAGIKVIREFSGCGLKTAKDAIEVGFDGTIALCDSRATAISLRDRLTIESGASLGTFEITRVPPARENEIKINIGDLYIKKKS